MKTRPIQVASIRLRTSLHRNSIITKKIISMKILGGLRMGTIRETQLLLRSTEYSITIQKKLPWCETPSGKTSGTGSFIRTPIRNLILRTQTV